MIDIIDDCCLTAYNTFRIPARCKKLIIFSEEEDLNKIFSSISGVNVLCLGSGSNLLFADDYYNGIVLKSNILSCEIDVADEYIYIKAGSGIVLDELIEQLCNSNIFGLENLSGIPGTVGASAVQNVGAYGVEAGQFIHSVKCFDIAKQCFCEFTHADCNFQYRYSIFKSPEFHGRYVITSVVYQIPLIQKANLSYHALAEKIDELGYEAITPSMIRNTLIKLRNSKLPNPEFIGSAGSFFKNPIVDCHSLKTLLEKFPELEGHYHILNDNNFKIPAAWLIDRAGFKGFRVGGAEVWHLQPLVIVNASNRATSTDVISLEQTIIRKIKEMFYITLEPEVEHIFSPE